MTVWQPRGREKVGPAPAYYIVISTVKTLCCVPEMRDKQRDDACRSPWLLLLLLLLAQFGSRRTHQTHTHTHTHAAIQPVTPSGCKAHQLVGHKIEALK